MVKMDGLTLLGAASTTTCQGKQIEEGEAVSDAPQPDWAALYLKHRAVMYRVASSTLRSWGLQDLVDDVVMSAMESLMKAPPANVRSWEAMFVTAVKRRAQDLCDSAHVRRSSGSTLVDGHFPHQEDIAADVVEAIDRSRSAAIAWDALTVLDDRHRFVAQEYIAQERPRDDVARDLGVTPARVSQMRTTALTQLRGAMKEEEVTTL